MQKNITDINYLISERERKLNAEYDAHKKRQTGIAAEAAVEAAKLQPAADQIANLRNQLNSLTARRENLLDEISIGAVQLNQQKELCARTDYIVGLIFGKPNGNMNDYTNQVEVNRNLPFAPMLVEKFTTLLESKNADLQAVEEEIIELAKATTPLN
jgi:DNA repair exonuclease SbcCD ATPase subunit